MQTRTIIWRPGTSSKKGFSTFDDQITDEEQWHGLSVP